MKVEFVKVNFFRFSIIISLNYLYYLLGIFIYLLKVYFFIVI